MVRIMGRGLKGIVKVLMVKDKVKIGVTPRMAIVVERRIVSPHQGRCYSVHNEPSSSHSSLDQDE